MKKPATNERRDHKEMAFLYVPSVLLRPSRFFFHPSTFVISSRHGDAHDIAPLADLRVGLAENALVFPDDTGAGAGSVAEHS